MRLIDADELLKKLNDAIDNTVLVEIGEDDFSKAYWQYQGRMNAYVDIKRMVLDAEEKIPVAYTTGKRIESLETEVKDLWNTIHSMKLACEYDPLTKILNMGKIEDLERRLKELEERKPWWDPYQNVPVTVYGCPAFTGPSSQDYKITVTSNAEGK